MATDGANERAQHAKGDRDSIESVSAIAAETAVLAHQTEEAAAPHPDTPLTPRPESIFRRRLRKFRKLRRGYWSFLVIVVAYIMSFLLPVLANNVALVVRYEGRYYFPIIRFYPAG